MVLFYFLNSTHYSWQNVVWGSRVWRLFSQFTLYYPPRISLSLLHIFIFISVALRVVGIPFCYVVKNQQATKQTPVRSRATQNLIKCSSVRWKWLRSPNLREAINLKSSGVRELYSVTPQNLTRWIMQRWRWKSRILRAKVIIYFRS